MNNPVTTIDKPAPALNQIKMPPFLQRIKWATDQMGYLEECFKLHPDIFQAYTFGYGLRTIYVHHPQALQQIFTNDKKQFGIVGKSLDMVKLFEDTLGSYSLLSLEGKEHQRQRKLLMPAFHGAKIEGYAKLICDITHEYMSQLTPNVMFSGLDLMANMTQSVILGVVLGLWKGERYQKFLDACTALFDYMHSPFAIPALAFPWLRNDLGLWSPWGKLIRLRQQLDELLYAEISSHRQNPELHHDILSLLLSAEDEDGQLMTEQEVRDEILTLISGGRDTTALTLSWGLYLLYHHYEVREKLLQELNSLDSLDDPISISKLPYLTAVCKEILRIHPVTPYTLPRVVKEPVEILGHHLEPGTIVMGCTYLLHKREELYPEPEKFKPERFLERKFSPYELMSFGAGTRSCVGEALAQLELKLILATILSNYELELVDNRPVKHYIRGFMVAPKGDIQMVLKNKR